MRMNPSLVGPEEGYWIWISVTRHKASVGLTQNSVW